MTIFNLYIFNREGSCVFYREWQREKQSGMAQTEEFKLMFGMLLSLRSFSERLSTRDGSQSVRHYRTSTYKMNYMETSTGIRMVLNTDPNFNGAAELVQTIYQVYVDTVVKNPLLDTMAQITSDLFSSKVDDVVTRQLNFK